MKAHTLFKFQLSANIKVDAALIPRRDSDGNFYAFEDPKTGTLYELTLSAKKNHSQSPAYGYTLEECGFEVEGRKSCVFEIHPHATFSDSTGRTLPLSAVQVIASRNAHASGAMLLGSETPDDLLQWATDADGNFDDDQVHALGFVYIAGEAKKEQVS